LKRTNPTRKHIGTFLAGKANTLGNNVVVKEVMVDE